MKKIVLTALIACIGTAWVVTAADARNVPNEPVRKMRESSKSAASVAAENGVSLSKNTIAAANTTLLASYRWNTGASCVTQGWVTQDLTVQTGNYVHVDNFAGLAGGNFGLLVPLAG